MSSAPQYSHLFIRVIIGGKTYTRNAADDDTYTFLMDKFNLAYGLFMLPSKNFETAQDVKATKFIPEEWIGTINEYVAVLIRDDTADGDVLFGERHHAKLIDLVTGYADKELSKKVLDILIKVQSLYLARFILLSKKQ